MSLTRQYQKMVREHWQKYLPTLWEELGRTNGRQPTILQAARRTRNAVVDLMAKGVRQDEAEEIFLPQWIMLPPEKATTGSEELDQEMMEQGMEI